MEEMFDVVDENDNVTGRESRSKVHAQNLLHRAVHILVFDAAGRVFLQKRSMTKDQCPGMWGTSCAGHLDAGETYDHAALREYSEELGVTPPPLVPVCKIPPSRATGYEHVIVYTCRDERPFHLQTEEIERGEWRDSADLAEYMAARPAEYTPSLRTVWNAWLATNRHS